MSPGMNTQCGGRATNSIQAALDKHAALPQSVTCLANAPRACVGGGWAGAGAGACRPGRTLELQRIGDWNCLHNRPCTLHFALLLFSGQHAMLQAQNKHTEPNKQPTHLALAAIARIRVRRAGARGAACRVSCALDLHRGIIQSRSA